jgi:membrane protease YdiL (CAAX protease family)
MDPVVALFIVAIGAALTALAALWVYRDGISRGMGHAALPWALAVVALFPAFFPIYTLCIRPRRQDEAGWGLPEVVGLLSLLAATLPAVVGLLLIAGMRMDFAFVSALIVAQSALLAGGCVYVAHRYGPPAAMLGYRANRWPLLIAASLLLSVPVVLAVHHLAQPAAVWLVGLFIGPEQARLLAEDELRRNPIIQAVPPLDDLARVTLFAFLICVLVPVAEETFFRGFAYPPLRRRYGALPAMLATAAAFGVLHVQIVNFLPIFLLGFILVLLYERTGSLLPPIALHAVNNLAALIAVYATR